jgi:hypothetical protein
VFEKGASMARFTVGDLEAYLRDHDVAPDAEVRIRRSGGTDVSGITAGWDPRAQVLILGEDDQVELE